MGDVKRYATVVIKRLDDSWALADWVPDDAFIALEIKYDALEKDYRDKLGQLLGKQRDNDALRTRLAEVERAMKAVSEMCLTTCNGERGDVYDIACSLALSEAVRILDTALGRQPLVLTAPTQEPTE